MRFREREQKAYAARGEPLATGCVYFGRGPVPGGPGVKVYGGLAGGFNRMFPRAR